MRAVAIAVAILFGFGCAQTGGRPAPSEREVAAKRPSAAGLIAADVPPPSPGWTDPVDFLALREAYGARIDFRARCEDGEAAKAAAEALVAQRFDEVVDLTSDPLRRCPVWSQLHLWRSAALRQLGRNIEADLHRRWFVSLTDSILASGDGKTAQTAYVTISTTEEYAVLTRLGLEPKQQALINGPPMLDLITAVDTSGRSVSVYFDPAWHFVRLIHEVTGE